MTPIKVKVSGVEYVVPAKYVTALRRKFDGQRAAEKGLGIDDARAFLGERAVCEVRFARSVPTDVRRRNCYRSEWLVAGMDLNRPCGRIALDVCNTLAERLVRKWARDGILERCGFGRYRRAE